MPFLFDVFCGEPEQLFPHWGGFMLQKSPQMIGLRALTNDRFIENTLLSRTNCFTG